MTWEKHEDLNIHPWTFVSIIHLQAALSPNNPPPFSCIFFLFNIATTTMSIRLVSTLFYFFFWDLSVLAGNNHPSHSRHFVEPCVTSLLWADSCWRCCSQGLSKNKKPVTKKIGLRKVRQRRPPPSPVQCPWTHLDVFYFLHCGVYY